MITISGDTIKSPSIKINTITSDSSSIKIDKELLCSDITDGEEITLTADTINIVGEIKRNGSSYTDEILDLGLTNAKKVLTTNLSWTVDSTSAESDTNFLTIEDAILESAKYVNTSTYTITITISQNTTIEQTIVQNIDLKHVRILGTLVLNTAMATYNAGHRPVFVFNNCSLPYMNVTITDNDQYSSLDYWITDSKGSIGETNGADVVLFNSDITFVSDIGYFYCVNSKVYISSYDIDGEIIVMNNSSVYIYNSTIGEATSSDIRVEESTLRIEDSTIATTYIEITSGTVFIKGTLTMKELKIFDSTVNIDLNSLIITNPDIVIYAYRSNLTVKTSSYTCTNTQHLYAQASNVFVSGLGAISNGSWTYDIEVLRGSIVSLYNTTPTAPSIALKTVTSNGIIIG